MAGLRSLLGQDVDAFAGAFPAFLLDLLARSGRERCAFASIRPEAAFRSPSQAERALLDRLLSAAAKGMGALRLQMASVAVRRIDCNASLEIDAPVAPIAEIAEAPVPVEIGSEDEDGVPIHVLLHVARGRAVEMEIYKDDSSKVRRMPGAGEFRISWPGQP